MDRSTTSAVDRSAAVRSARFAALDVLLPAPAGERGESAPAPEIGRTVPGVSVLRQPQDGGDAGSQPQAHPAADADFGNRSPLSETEPESTGTRARGLPVPVAWRLDRTAQSSLEHRY